MKTTVYSRLVSLARGQRGVSAIETAIILIAFIVVASVAAYALLASGIMTAGQNREVVRAGTGSAGGTMILRGAVTAFGTPPNTVDRLVFYVVNATESGSAVNLSSSGADAMTVVYTDDFQAVNLAPGSGWSAKWVIGSGNLLEAGERVEIRVTLTGLATPLGSSSTFKLQLQSGQSSALVVQRSTPSQIQPIMDLR